MVTPVDQGAILRSGAALIPDLQHQLMQRQQMDMQRQSFGLQQAKFAAEQQEAMREQAQEQAYQRDMEMIGALPADQQPQALAALSRRYPKQSEALKRSWDMQDQALKDANFRDTSNLYFMIKNGAADKAAAQIRKRIEADRAAGQDTEDDEAIALALESGDPAEINRAMAAVTAQLQIAAGPDKFASISGVIAPEPGAIERNADYLARVDGEGAADLYRRSIYDPIATVPLPGGRTYVGPRSGLGGISSPGGEATQGGGDSSGGGVDRGTRNNNPGNLKDGPFARRQPGYKGADRDGFAIFESAAAGNGAQERLLAGSYLSKGHDTPAKIIARYAPAGENSSASMTNYAAYVARRLGIGVNDKVPAGKAGLLAQAMREFETGKTVKAAAPKSSGPVRVTSIAQAKSLPSGTEFIDPRGVRRRVP